MVTSGEDNSDFSLQEVWRSAKAGAKRDLVVLEFGYKELLAYL